MKLVCGDPSSRGLLFTRRPEDVGPQLVPGNAGDALDVENALGGEATSPGFIPVPRRAADADQRTRCFNAQALPGSPCT